MKNLVYFKNANLSFITIVLALCALNIPIAFAKLSFEPQQKSFIAPTTYKLQTSRPLTPYDYQPYNHEEKKQKCYWLTPFQPSEGCQYQEQQKHYNVLLGKWRKSPPLSLQQQQFGVKVHL